VEGGALLAFNVHSGVLTTTKNNLQIEETEKGRFVKADFKLYTTVWPEDSSFYLSPKQQCQILDDVTPNVKYKCIRMVNTNLTNLSAYTIVSSVSKYKSVLALGIPAVHREGVQQCDNDRRTLLFDQVSNRRSRDIPQNHWW
jgi:hypothetical protein